MFLRLGNYFLLLCQCARPDTNLTLTHQYYPPKKLLLAAYSCRSRDVTKFEFGRYLNYSDHFFKQLRYSKVQTTETAKLRESTKNVFEPTKL